MIGRSGPLARMTLRRLLGMGPPQIERRVANLPVQVERRRGPRCENCGFGTLHAVPEGQPNAGRLRCDHPGCGQLSDRIAKNAMESVIRAS